MNLKKLALISAALSGIALVAFVGCKQDANPTTNKTITVKEVKIGDGTYSNGALDVDPTKVSTIDITFEEPMDKRYTAWIYYNDNFDIGDSFLGARWMNDYTCRFYIYLTYGVNYKFIINDNEYESDSYSPQQSFWRSTEGDFAKKIIIAFSTKESSIQHPYTHKVVVDDITEEYPITLSINEYAPEDAPNQQATVPLLHCLNHEKILNGDTVEIAYKVRVQDDAKKIMTNIVETSSWANYWKVLNENEDVLIIDEDGLKGSTAEAPIYKEGTLKFDITEDMIGKVYLQVYTLLADNPDLVTLIYAPLDK